MHVFTRGGGGRLTAELKLHYAFLFYNEFNLLTNVEAWKFWGPLGPLVSRDKGLLLVS